MFLRLGAVVSMGCSLVALAQPVSVPALTDAEKKKLDQGGVVVHELKPTDNSGVAGMAFGVVEASSDEVWPIVRDCEHFSKFLPSTKKSWRKGEGSDQVCYDELELPFPLTNLWAETRSVAREEPQGYYLREWSFVKGTYKRNRGSWRVVPWGEDGKRSLVIYEVDSDPSMLVPDWILRAAQTGSLPKIFEGVRKRVLVQRAANPAPAPAPAAAPAPAPEPPAPAAAPPAEATSASAAAPSSP